MFDLYIDPTSGDLAYEKGGLQLVRAPNKRVRQELETTLRTFQGEWFNNTSFGGINRQFLGRIGITKPEVDAWYRSIILANPEVLELVSFESSWNRLQRHYELEFVVRTAGGQESAFITISPEASTEYVQPPQSDYTPPTTPSVKGMSAFITGTSSVTAFISQEAIQFSATISASGAITASILREFVSASMSASSPVTSGLMVKNFAAALSGSGAISANISTVMQAAITSYIGDWEKVVDSYNDMRIVNNTVVRSIYSNTNMFNRVKEVAFQAPPDQFAEMEIDSFSVGSSAVLLRANKGSTPTAYMILHNVSSSLLRIYRLVAGVSTIIAQGALSTPTMPYTLRGEAEGNLIRAFVDGNLELSVNDSVITSGQPGILISAVSDSVISSFSAGDIAEEAVFTDNFNRSVTHLAYSGVEGGMYKNASYTTAGTSSVTSTMVKSFSATITGSGDITAGIAYGFGAVISGSTGVTATIVKNMAATIAGTSTTTATFQRGISATISGSGAITGALSKRLSAAVSGTNGISATMDKRLHAYITSGNSTNAIMRKVLSATMSGNHNLTAAILKGGSAAISGSHTISANIRKIKYGSANISGGSNTVSGNLTKQKFASASITNTSPSVVATINYGHTEFDADVISRNPIVYAPFTEIGSSSSGREFVSYPSSGNIIANTSNYVLGVSSLSGLAPNRAVTIASGANEANISVSSSVASIYSNTQTRTYNFFSSVNSTNSVIFSGSFQSGSNPPRFSIWKLSNRTFYVRLDYAAGSPLTSYFWHFSTPAIAAGINSVMVTVVFRPTAPGFSNYLGGFVEMYINGVPQVTGLTSNGFNIDSYIGLLGSGSGVINTPDGGSSSFTLERFAVFNGALTPAEILALYNKS